MLVEIFFSFGSEPLPTALLFKSSTILLIKYFLEYLIAYKKPILIAFHYENGKRIVIRNKFKKLFDGNSAADKTKEHASEKPTEKDKASSEEGTPKASK